MDAVTERKEVELCVGIVGNIAMPASNVRTVLNVVRRPETLRSGVVPLVEKRVESLQHESLVLFLDCLRHLILLRFTLPRLSVP